MAEYIEREALGIGKCNPDVFENKGYAEGWNSAVEIMMKAPTADVVEVKHGEWIEYQTPNIICCSECDWGTGVDEKTFKYCPNCGAKMDKKEGAEE